MRNQSAPIIFARKFTLREIMELFFPSKTEPKNSSSFYRTR